MIHLKVTIAVLHSFTPVQLILAACPLKYDFINSGVGHIAHPAPLPANTTLLVMEGVMPTHITY